MPDAAPVGTPPPSPTLMLSAPGVGRDGTRLSQKSYTDAQWCRFYQALPRKMLGYREQIRDMQGIVRQFDVESYNGYSYVHAGTQDLLSRYTINIQTGLTSGIIDRTPSGFTASPLNNWQFSVMYDTANDSNLIFAHAAPNIEDITSTAEFPIYYSNVQGTAALLPISGSDVSGGMVAVWPYVVRFGNDGYVAWNAPGDPTDLSGTGSGEARPCGNKVVKGLPVRGPAGVACLLWSLDSLVQMQFIGGDLIWNFTTLTTTSSILSSSGVIENNGIYYWATVSGFSTFNGVIQDLPNSYNLQWFLDNLNFNQRQKVFAMKIPRWGEIWWCFPFGNAIECTHAIIYNYILNVWYDTMLPSVGRSAGVYEQIYHYPIMASPTTNDTGGTSTWQHEFGLDEISGANPSARAIPSWVETHQFSLINSGTPGTPGIDRAIAYSTLEPDFNQAGDLNYYVTTRANARARENIIGPTLIPAVYSNQEQLAEVKITGRLATHKIVSNVAGGNYIFGSPLIHIAPSDGRRKD